MGHGLPNDGTRLPLRCRDDKFASARAAISLLSPVRAQSDASSVDHGCAFHSDVERVF